ncbi:MAG: hypothetical protein ABID61_01535 [Candidatus Micrarchaeota archaeon]
MQRHATRTTNVVDRLVTHPLIEPITGNTYRIKGGWANGFVFVPDVRENKCVIIDPGTSKTLEKGYKEMYGAAVRRVVEQEKIDLMAALQDKTQRMALLHRIRAGIGRDIGNGFGDLFLERSVVLQTLVRDCELEVMMVVATHHHIDHLGVGHDLATRLGVECYLPNPRIFETDVLRGFYPGEPQHNKYRRLGTGEWQYGILITDISGHTEMVGFLLPDKTLVVGDLVCSERMWNCSVLYVEDIYRHLGSLEVVRRLRYEKMLLGHGNRTILPSLEALQLVERNIRRVENAMKVANRDRDDVVAAETYLKPGRGVDLRYIGHALITADHIGAYRT